MCNISDRNSKLKIVRHTIVSLVVVCFSSALFSQVNHSFAAYYKGRVVSEENKPLEYTHVINLNQGYATISDSMGCFKIHALPGDSIMISSIGYYSKYLFISEEDDDIHIITLKDRIYDIAIVNIEELRWQIFKSEFMEKKIEEKKTEKRISNWMHNLVLPDEMRMIYQEANRNDWLYLDKYKR